MNQSTLQDFLTWLEEQVQICRSRQAEKFADDRKDEGVFEKIRANVYEIFRAVAVTAAKVKPTPEVYSFLRDRLTAIPAAWQRSLEEAQAHADEEKAQIERIKLDTVQAICRKAESLWEDA